MARYMVECTRIREVLERCMVEIEANSEDAAIDAADQRESDGDLNFIDDDDLPDWSRQEYEVTLLDDKKTSDAALA